MDIFPFEDETEYRYEIPYNIFGGGPIETARRNDYINALRRGALKRNGNFTILRHIGEHFLTDTNDVPNEDILIIKTYGKIPLPEKALKLFVDYLSQESLYVGEGDQWKKYLHNEQPRSLTEDDVNGIEHGHGSYSVYEIKHNDDGMIYLKADHFGYEGSSKESIELKKNDINTIISLGDEALKKLQDTYTDIVGRA